MSRYLRRIVLIMTPIALLGLGGQVQAQADVDCNKCVDASDIAKEAINASKIAKNAVTTNKLKDKAVTGAKLGPGVPRTIKQGGYDLYNLLVDSADPEAHFDSPSNGGAGNTRLTLKGGENVLLIGSVQVYRDPEDAASGDIITGSLIPCYWNTDLALGEPGAVYAAGFSGEDERWNAVTPICQTSTGADDQGSVATSFLFKNMPAGKFEFGLCPSKWNGGGCESEEAANFIVLGTKIAIIKTN